MTRNQTAQDPIPLAQSRVLEKGTADERPRMPEPPPVRLLTVNDAVLLGPAGAADHLDSFYVDLLGFGKDLESESLAYLAENFRIVFDFRAPPVERDELRPLGIVVASLADAEGKLLAAEIPCLRQRGLTPGQESLLLRDPAGNWIELSEATLVG